LAGGALLPPRASEVSLNSLVKVATAGFNSAENPWTSSKSIEQMQSEGPKIVKRTQIEKLVNFLHFFS
jgi:hypothetical protein